RTLSMISFGIAVFILTIAAGCSSKSKSNTAAEKASTEPGGKTNPATSQSSPNPGIDLQCVMERIQNPSESFHYLYKKDSTNPVHQEADVTPQSIDGFRRQFDGSPQPLHATRSDQQSWQGALA